MAALTTNIRNFKVLFCFTQACQMFGSVKGVGIEYDQKIFVRACELVRSNALEKQVNTM
jgi:hypothetical protein